MTLQIQPAQTNGPDVNGQRNTKLCGKIALFIAEDWFALSHFRPLIAVLTQVARSVVVVTRSSGRLGEIEALGVRVVDFNFRRDSNNPLTMARVAWGVSRILQRERPDAVHVVAMKPIILTGLALRLVSVPHVVVHLTGQGLIGVTSNPMLRLYRFAILRVLAFVVRKPTSYLLVENPDDLALVQVSVSNLGVRFAVLGGAGVNQNAFPALAPPENAVPVAAYVGRMIRLKGVDLLMQAYEKLLANGVPIRLELFGDSDADNAEMISPAEIEAWCQKSGARWHGQIADVVEVWRRADIFVLPSRGGEGLPRALLEAASCARPLIATDVPGIRHFLRDGIEGLLIPVGDVAAIADALQQLAGDAEQRLRMGEAARRRLLAAYTEAHIEEALLTSYQRMLTARLSVSADGHESHA